MTGPVWQASAACAEYPTDLFFSGDSDTEAIAVCEACPVKAECLAEALATPVRDDHGVAGGLTAAQRRTLRRRNGKTVTEPEPPEPPEPDVEEPPMTDSERAIVVGLLGVLERIRAWRLDPNPEPEPPVGIAGRCRRRPVRDRRWHNNR